MIELERVPSIGKVSYWWHTELIATGTYQGNDLSVFMHDRTLRRFTVKADPTRKRLVSDIAHDEIVKAMNDREYRKNER